MHAVRKVFNGGQLKGAGRWLSITVGTTALIGASAVSVASPARADSVNQVCNTFHSWTECISYDYTNGDIAVNALNGYSTTEAESLWFSYNGGIIASQGFSIPPNAWRGFSYYWGVLPADQVCGGIDSVTIVCTNF